MNALTRERIEYVKFLAEGVHPFAASTKIESQDIRDLCDMALRSLEAPASATRTTDEVAWLVESVGGRWGTGFYWTGVGDYDGWGTIDLAVRFCRKEDAERVITSLTARDGAKGRRISGNGPQYEACEHLWLSVTPRPEERDNWADYIGWARYVVHHDRPTRLLLCDSDDLGAFKIYRAKKYRGLATEPPMNATPAPEARCIPQDLLEEVFNALVVYSGLPKDRWPGPPSTVLPKLRLYMNSGTHDV